MDPATIAALLPMMIQSGKTIFDMFKKQPGSPTDAAAPWLDKAQGLYEPYQKQGQEAGNQLFPDYSNMMKDPGAYLDQMMKGYQPSQGYQNKFNAMSQAAANTAAAGGMRGSLSDIQNQAGISQSLMGDDMQQWLQNVGGIKGQGMQGLEGFNQRGYDASNNMANIYGNRGNMDVLSQMFKMMQSQGGQNDMWSNLSNLAGGVSKLFPKNNSTTSFGVNPINPMNPMNTPIANTPSEPYAAFQNMPKPTDRWNLGIQGR